MRNAVWDDEGSEILYEPGASGITARTRGSAELNVLVNISKHPRYRLSGPDLDSTIDKASLLLCASGYAGHGSDCQGNNSLMHHAQR